DVCRCICRRARRAPAHRREAWQRVCGKNRALMTCREPRSQPCLNAGLSKGETTAELELARLENYSLPCAVGGPIPDDHLLMIIWSFSAQGRPIPDDHFELFAPGGPIPVVAARVLAGSACGPPDVSRGHV